MSELLKNINILLADAIQSEHNTMTIYTKLVKAYEELGNEKFEDVAGLYKPNLFMTMQDIKNHVENLESLKFSIESRLTEKEKKESENIINKWNKSIEIIPLKDEFSLEGIETWHVSHYEMIPNSTEIHSPLFKEDALKLLAAGFNLAINDELGTGSIIVTNDGFDIELWQHMNKKIIHKKTLDDVLDWLISFYDEGKT